MIACVNMETENIKDEDEKEMFLRRIVPFLKHFIQLVIVAFGKNEKYSAEKKFLEDFLNCNFDLTC